MAGLRILCVLHDCLSPAGTLGLAIAGRGGEYDEVTPHDGDPLPGDHTAYDGVIVLGGPMGADDDENYPHFQDLIALLQGFHAAGKPMMGVCLGAQLFARVFDRRVLRHHELEFGFTEIAITEAGAGDPLLAGLGRRQWLMEWHQDTFELPEGAVLLATGERCPNQACRIGENAYAFQFHFETTRPIVRSWVNARREFLRVRHPDFFARIKREFDLHMADQMAFCLTVGDRWFKLVETRRRGAGAARGVPLGEQRPRQNS